MSAFIVDHIHWRCPNCRRVFAQQWTKRTHGWPLGDGRHSRGWMCGGIPVRTDPREAADGTSN